MNGMLKSLSHRAGLDTLYERKVSLTKTNEQTFQMTMRRMQIEQLKRKEQKVAAEL